MKLVKKHVGATISEINCYWYFHGAKNTFINEQFWAKLIKSTFPGRSLLAL
jgi:hypothetical protein